VSFRVFLCGAGAWEEKEVAVSHLGEERETGIGQSQKRHKFMYKRGGGRERCRYNT
jgi:hypothetical protein